MSYSIGQYFHIPNTDSDKFKTVIPNEHITNSIIDSDITIGNTTITCKDNGFYLDNGYQPNQNYYICCEIESLSTDQVFYVKLINEANPSSKTQYIKTIKIAKDSGTHMIDFIFSPIEHFETLVFELQRTAEDYSKPRGTSIKRKELSIVNNILGGALINAKELVKIGVQAAPGTKMCINNEEINVGRTGVYEIKNGIITVDFFSIVALGNTIPGFTLDYIYEKEDN